MTIAEPIPLATPTDAAGIQPLKAMPRRWAQTSLNATALTRRIAVVIEQWEVTLTGVLAGSYARSTSMRDLGTSVPTLILVHDSNVLLGAQNGVDADHSDYPDDPVAAVAFLARTVQISQDEVLGACGIAERTFFGWKTTGRRARATSTGTLWALVEAVYYLRDSHPNLAALLHSTPAAKAAFTAGDADQLVDIELSGRTVRQPHTSEMPDFGDDGTWPPPAGAGRNHTFTTDAVQSTTFPRR